MKDDPTPGELVAELETLRTRRVEWQKAGAEIDEQIEFILRRISAARQFLADALGPETTQAMAATQTPMRY